MDNLMLQNFMAKIGIEKREYNGKEYVDNKIVSFLIPKMTEAMPAKEKTAEKTEQSVPTATGNAIEDWD